MIIPTSVRKLLGIKTGDELLFQVDDEGLLVTTLKQRIANAQRRVRKYVKPGTSLVDELIAGRRAEAQKEVK